MVWILSDTHCRRSLYCDDWDWEHHSIYRSPRFSLLAVIQEMYCWRVSLLDKNLDVSYTYIVWLWTLVNDFSEWCFIGEFFLEIMHYASICKVSHVQTSLVTVHYFQGDRNIWKDKETFLLFFEYKSDYFVPMPKLFSYFNKEQNQHLQFSLANGVQTHWYFRLWQLPY